MDIVIFIEQHLTGTKQMTKLIRAYHANPTRLNALKIKHYNQKHPMAACMLIGFEAVILKSALEHAEKQEA